MKSYAADFETATWNPEETWVWAWAVCEIGNKENIKIDNNIDSFIEFCKKEHNATFYFHNLKFDGEFIIYWLLTNGFKHVINKEDIEDNTFTSLIDEMGQFYTITIYYKKGNKSVHKTTFIDSLKIINLSVKEIAEAYNLPEQKGEIDYKEERPQGHILTEIEKDYIKNDVVIVAEALKEFFEEGLTRMTAASNALYDYKDIITKNRFNHFFPQLDSEVDKDLRKAYKGGFTYLNPIYKAETVENINVLDVNSLYPSVMYEKELPFGEPVFFEGKYQEDRIYPLYIQMITCTFDVKENKIPTIQIKNNRLFFIANEYLEHSGTEDVCLVLTNIDLKLFLEQYDVHDLKYIAGWKFKSKKGLFTDYIDKWINKKIEASKQGNKGQRYVAKKQLNSLYGKFAAKLEGRCKNPYLDENGVVRYEIGEVESKNGVYLPMRLFYNCLCKRKND